MTVLTRPMFRRNGSPSVGERSANLRSLIEDIEDVKNLSPNIVGPPTIMDQERLGIRTKLGKSLLNELMQPFEEFAGKYVRNTKTGKFEPMSGGTEGMSVVREGEETLDTVIVIDRREGSETFGMPIGVPRNMDTYEMIKSGDFEEISREILDRAKGSPKEGEESDAVGIADGLDQETPKADPNKDGIAKVSPKQYVELMNQIRGDEVSREGRVQELAGVVGEQDAQATPLSVLALVQPVFEMRENKGIATAPQAQPMLRMSKGGIVKREKGTSPEGESSSAFDLLSGIYGKDQVDAIRALGKDFFGLESEPFDTDLAKAEYERQLMSKEDFRNKATLEAAPYLFQIGSLALDPNVTTPQLIAAGASGLGKFGTNIGKAREQIKGAALKLALADKKSQEDKETAFVSAALPTILQNTFKDPDQAALDILEIQDKKLEIVKKEAEIGVLDEKLITELEQDKANLQKTLIENETLSETNQLMLQEKIVTIEGLLLDNTAKGLDNQFKEITNSLAEDKENASLQNQLLENINLQLENETLRINNEFLPEKNTKQLEELDKNIELLIGQTAGQAITNEKGLIELENYNAMQTLELIEKQEQINKLVAEASKIDFEKYNSMEKYRKEFDDLRIVKNTDLRYQSYLSLLANARKESAAGDVAFIFDFMRMIDPQSVVREGEFQLAEDASPLMKKLDKALQKAKAGERLLPDQRADFLSTAGGMLEQQINLYNDTLSTYSDLAVKLYGEEDASSALIPLQFDEKILNTMTNVNEMEAYLRSIEG